MMIRVVLVIATLVALAVGIAVLCFPVQFYAGYDVALGGQTDLLSDVRAQGAVLVVGGTFLSLGIFSKRRQRNSLLVGALLYGSYGLARLLSFGLDGAPGSSLMYATLIEMVIGLACLVALFERRAVHQSLG